MEFETYRDKFDLERDGLPLHGGGSGVECSPDAGCAAEGAAVDARQRRSRAHDGRPGQRRREACSATTHEQLAHLLSVKHGRSFENLVFYTPTDTYGKGDFTWSFLEAHWLLSWMRGFLWRT